MAENTKIEWAHHTFNPWEGCQKVGPGCDHCYAEARNARFAGGASVNWGPGAPRRRTGGKNWKLPLKWNADAAGKGIRYRVFCASLADVFDNAVPITWRVDLLDLIRHTRSLDWLLLTKRIGNVVSLLQQAQNYIHENWPAVDVQALSQWVTDWLEGGAPPANVWLGSTVVNQEEADRDIQKLLRVPAAKRFLSMEPLLGPTLVGPYLSRTNMPVLRFMPGFVDSMPGVDWVIAGGESGSAARPMHPDWARSLRDQCTVAGVPFLFKQWGEWQTIVDMSIEAICRTPGNALGARLKDGTEVFRCGKKTAGRLLDGREWNEVPA